MKIRAVLFILLASLLFLIPINPVAAHDQPLAVQEIRTNYARDYIEVQYNLYMDPVVLDQIYPLIDTGNDGSISLAEIDTFSEQYVLKNMTGRLNNRDVTFKKHREILVKRNDIQSMEEYISISYVVENPVLRETNSFYLKYNHIFLPNDSFGDLIVYVDNINENPDFLSRLSTNQDKDLAPNDYLVDYKISGVTNPLPTPTPEQIKRGVRDIFSDMAAKSTELTNRARNYNFKEGRFGLFLLSLLITFIAGALHAVTPGHGKSMMAAFLIGKRESKFADVVVLGLSITLAHTFVIYILGFTLLWLNKTSSATHITLWIEKASSILLFLLAAMLIRNGYKAYKRSKLTVSSRHHEQKTDMPQIRNRWDLFLAGVAGGIVPCIDALSILFVAVNVGKISLGLIMILFFSLGLAGAIILLGSMLIYGKNKINLEKRFGPVALYYAPILSGIVIMCISLVYFFKK